MQIAGKIYKIFDEQQVSDTFKKRQFVIDYSENQTYREYIIFDFVQDKCDILDAFKVGDDVEVFFNIRGREWQSSDGNVKYFNTLQAWRMTKINADIDSPSKNSTEEDDLPF